MNCEENKGSEVSRLWGFGKVEVRCCVVIFNKKESGE